jgi:hypothetical protein
VIPAIQELGPCPCLSCDIVGTKLAKVSGHLVGCACISCRNRNNRSRGHRKQSRVLKDAARAEGTSMLIAPTHEEQAKLLLHYESKSGTSLPKGMSGAMMASYEKQARDFAEFKCVPSRKWALVFTFPSGKRRIWMDYEQFLALVSEIQELP